MKSVKFLFTVVLTFFAFSALATLKPTEQSYLWDKTKMPDYRTGEYKEVIKKNGDTGITSVSEASWEFFKAKSKTPTGLVIVCPGGAYKGLAYTHEGLEIAEFLVEEGVSAVILKYRIPNHPKGALQDIQRMIRFARSKAKEWNVNPNKIAVMGFSAGANLCARASTRYNEKIYESIDEIDEISARPDGTILIYPAYCDKRGNDTRWNGVKRDLTPISYNVDYALAEELKVDKNTPPAFIIQTQPDVNYINSSIAYYLALKNAKVPANLHLFDEGKHGYGLRTGKNLVRAWSELLEDWLKFYNFIPKED